ncbi:hypothetical protein Hanom_Chr10g00917161 [Helianthus anomalus]
MVDMSDRRLTLREGDTEMKFEVGQRVKEDPVKYLKTIDSSLDYALSWCISECKLSRSGNIL